MYLAGSSYANGIRGDKTKPFIDKNVLSFT